MKEYYLKTESGNVFYKISEPLDSSRMTLFFLHGLTGDHTMFRYQEEYFSRDCNIILWDAPAHGRSRPFRDFSYEKAAGAIKNIFEKHSIPSAVFIGQSMGGFITQAVIKRYPSLVRAFAAIDSCPYGDYYSRSDIFWLRQVEWMAKLYPMKLMKTAMAKQVSQTPDGYENMMQMLSVYEKNELCHLMGIGYAGFLTDNCELDIKCPVLLLLGENDITGKVRAYNKMWTKRTGFELVVIKNARHNSNIDNPDAVNSAIEKFLCTLKKVD